MKRSWFGVVAGLWASWITPAKELFVNEPVGLGAGPTGALLKKEAFESVRR
jgi:hypothetical protein